jgi:1,4-dihydroxy-2-naphthoyl-CoA synthase
MEALMSGRVPECFDVEDKTVSRQLKSLSRAAPIALTMASALLDDATTTGDDIDTGLALELERLAEIFGTADALEGLSALIEGRRPSYTAA